MKSRRIKIILVIVLLAVLGLAGWYAWRAKHKPPVTSNTNATDNSGGSSHGNQAPSTLFTVTNSGSTNTIGWTIVVKSDGSGSRTYARAPKDTSVQLSQTYPVGFFDTKNVKDQLAAFGDVSRLGAEGCVKSVSFGTTEIVTVGRRHSKDISCTSTDPVAQALADTIRAVIKPATKDVVAR